MVTEFSLADLGAPEGDTLGLLWFSAVIRFLGFSKH